MFIELTNMTKFYEVSKVLDKRTDAHGRVQFLVRWRAGGGVGSEVWNLVYMIAPVKKFGRVRLSTNFPSKQIWRRIQTWKDDEFLLSFKFSRLQTWRRGFHELFYWNFSTSAGMMYEQFMGYFTFRDSASGQVQLFISSVNFTSDHPAPSLIFFR